MKLAAKIFLFVIIGIVVFTVTLIYGSLTGPVACWLVLWMLTFALLLFWRGSLQERGLIFLISSLVISIGGQQLLEEMYGKHFIVNVLAQVFIVMGSGIGANLISSWLIDIEAKNNKAT